MEKSLPTSVAPLINTFSERGTSGANCKKGALNTSVKGNLIYICTEQKTNKHTYCMYDASSTGFLFLRGNIKTKTTKHHSTVSGNWLTLNTYMHNSKRWMTGKDKIHRFREENAKNNRFFKLKLIRSFPKPPQTRSIMTDEFCSEEKPTSRSKSKRR